MIVKKRRILSMLAAIAFGCIFFAGQMFAETVTLTHTYTTGGAAVPSATPAPVAASTLTASPSNPGTVLNVVFYKNDVPIKTVTASPFKADLGELGQDRYTFRVRANYLSGVFADSADIKLTAHTREVYKMGTTFLGVYTEGPKRWGNHTEQIQNALYAISEEGGGTLFFPCTYGQRYSYPSQLDQYAVYTINDTIKVPKNVTLQGEAAGDNGKCQIWWYEPSFNPYPCAEQRSANLLNKPMFRVFGKTTNVRFKDLALRSIVAGEHCYFQRPLSWIAGDGTTAIEINTKGKKDLDPTTDGDISDVIIENVAISLFTRGVSAYSTSSVYKISNVKVRGALGSFNHRNVYVNAALAHDWDFQNFNAIALGENQAALEVVKAGVPASYTGKGDLRFLQLNCAGGSKRGQFYEDTTIQIPPSKCIIINKHGGLYFKQLHVEGPETGMIVEKLTGETNDAPIVMEASVLSGEFKDASMKLYTIGSFLQAAPETPEITFWDLKMNFSGDGLQSKVVDCGNYHFDRTDVDGDPYDTPTATDWQMVFSHSERSRPSYFDVTNSTDFANNGYAFKKEPIPCALGRSDGTPDVNTIGGAYFDSGILPTEATIPYTNPLDCNLPASEECDLTGRLAPIFASTSNGGAVRIAGNWKINEEVVIPPGRIIVGVGATITLRTAGLSMFRRPIGWESIPNPPHQPTVRPIAASYMVLRDLTLKASTQDGTTAIRYTGVGPCTPGSINCAISGATDFYFSGLHIEGFNIGFFGGRWDINSFEPQLDTLGLKNLKFVNNKTAAIYVEASNASNWNMMNLDMQSGNADAMGYRQHSGGHQSFQGIKCAGVSGTPMASCLRLEMTGAAVTDIKQGTHVTDLVRIESPLDFFGTMTGALLIRDSDFRSAVPNMSRFNINGKIFITSMNNKYQYWAQGVDNEWNLSRVTYCGDDFAGGAAFPTIDAFGDNLYFGVDLRLVNGCKSENPKPWSEAFKWGGRHDLSVPAENDTPLTGNFYHDVQEDYVIYQRTAQSKFLIRKGTAPVPSETPTKSIDWGLPGDTPVVGRFLASTPRSQIVAFRAGMWWVKDPNDVNPSNFWAYFLGQAGATPFAGNFFQEGGGASAERDEIAIFRPGSDEIRIQNPRTPSMEKVISLGAYRGNQVEVGDFLGVGYDQVAIFNDTTGGWYIIDANPTTPVISTATLGEAGDVAVAGKYLPQRPGYANCAQLGVWRPLTEEFVISDPSAACGGRGIAPGDRMAMRWGSNNNYLGNDKLDDVPLTINVSTSNGILDRPVAYRPTPGQFVYSRQNGLWFTHDPF